MSTNTAAERQIRRWLLSLRHVPRGRVTRALDATIDKRLEKLNREIEAFRERRPA